MPSDGKSSHEHLVSSLSVYSWLDIF